MCLETTFVIPSGARLDPRETFRGLNGQTPPGMLDQTGRMSSLGTDSARTCQKTSPRAGYPAR